MAEQPKDLMAALRASVEAAKTERLAPREGDGLSEGWRERLGRVAKLLSETAATTDTVLLRVYPDDFSTRFPFAADIRAALAAASQGGGGLVGRLDGILTAAAGAVTGHTNGCRCEQCDDLRREGLVSWIDAARQDQERLAALERAAAAPPPAETGAPE